VLGAGVAVPSGPLATYANIPTQPKLTSLSLGRILAIPLGWRKVVRWTFTEFRYAFVHTLPLDDARAIWDAQIVPDSGRPFFEGAFSMLDRRSPASVNFANPTRAPLLLIAGLADRALPPVIARRTLRAYQASPARTELRTFDGRTHWVIAQPGWEEVAQGCLDWLESIA
jgi:pimeloyl-ACP methyl ester carboxylesterase